MNQKVLAQRAAQKKCDHAAGPDKVVFRSRPKPARPSPRSHRRPMPR